ncbi:hypothetical protein P175DRAFT_0431308 [Aspergillus ochraceoroseus IBT 24754]|uniref:C2H2-type domain-containing protein n=1 Tax=Aspergillus ochraceoroseus IBT 24754 TaxID=1392256 RepID=A0A2T5M3T2_9EURO|nr:uncharacterized protein P175DRAFT_0431308 [Aspergillus ochraceoroseus IBT 24754]PTU23198.1 hypothetical protein P175DRAFT_0431308 [Aspergillus ochraceoroseus IBT 24754]
MVLANALSYSHPLSTSPTFPRSPRMVEVGLGISTCGSEPPVNQLSHFPSAEDYAIPTTGWPSQLMPSTLPPHSTLDTTHLSPATYYETYSGSDVSASPLSYCDPRTMSASPSRGSIMDIGPPQDVLGGHASYFWPNNSSSDTLARVKQDPDAEYQDRSFLEDPALVGLPAFTNMENEGERVPPKPENLEEEDSGKLAEIDLHMERTFSCDLPVEPAMFPFEVISKWMRENIAFPNCEKPKISSANGLLCTICGVRFTRRSNCREHMKRHDPNSRKTFPCEICEKPFGRKTDLKRHVGSVHYGLRKFGCEQCGFRFSRQDTLAR